MTQEQYWLDKAEHWHAYLMDQKGDDAYNEIMMWCAIIKAVTGLEVLE